MRKPQIFGPFLSPNPAMMVNPIMRGVKLVIGWCFAAIALLAFWDVVRFLPTKVYIDGSGSDPSLIAKAGLIAIFVAIGSLFATAWWLVLKQRDSARTWALFASFVLTSAGFLLLYAHPTTLIEKGWIPLAIGLTGLAVFYRHRGNDRQGHIAAAPVPPDGTNAFLDKLVVVLAVIAVFAGNSFWSNWADSHELSQRLPSYFYVRFAFAVLLVIVLHEGGHLFAALALRMKVIQVAIGPMVWSNSLGKRRIRFSSDFRSWLRGYTLVAPTDVLGFRERKIVQVAAGPFVSIATGIVAATGVSMSIGSAWEGSWQIVSNFATISLVMGIFNLFPFRIRNGYSDGAKLVQLISSGIWCRYHLLLGMIYASGVTPIRARDFDIDTIQEAAGTVARGQDELFMHLCAYGYFLDREDLADAATALSRAANFCKESSIAVPAEWTLTFAFGTAFLLRDPVGARVWWNEFERQKTDKLVLESWTSLCALSWLEGRREAAEEAWHKAEEWVQQMSDSGFAEGERHALLLLRRAMDEAHSGSKVEQGLKPEFHPS